MSFLIKSLGDRGRDGEVGRFIRRSKTARMHVSELSCRKVLLGTGLAISLSFAQIGFENSPFPCRASISGKTT